MINSLLDLDILITSWIHRLFPHNQFFNLFFSFFSLYGGSIAIWSTIMLFLIIFEEKRSHKFILSFIITFAVTGLLVNYVIKNIVRRPRPSYVKTYSCPSDFSFPSGHASVAFASAAIISFYDKKRKWVYYSVAILISLSRIYLGCHFFLDVITGSIIGHFIAVNTLNLLPKKKLM